MPTRRAGHKLRLSKVNPFSKVFFSFFPQEFNFII